MRKLLIVDPTLQSLEGHSYNYDLAIYQAAGRCFDEVLVYADRDFRDPSGRLERCRAVLNRLRIDRLKRSVNSVFHVFGRKKGEATSAHATVVPGVWSWMIGLAKWLRARDLESSLHAILREHDPNDELHIFIQHAHLSELQLAARWNEAARLHLVLRYSPDLVNNGQMADRKFSALLSGLRPSVRLYTDSERLSAQYTALGARQVTTLPVPIVVPERPVAGNEDGVVRLAFLGSSRVEKGYCELPRLIERLPRESGGRSIAAMVQVTVDSADPRIREATRKLAEVAHRLPAGTVELLESPVPMDTYYGWVARSGIVALPYLSKKYNASTSGIFVEALCFGVPVICPAESWMADIVAEAAREHLRIGEVAALDEIPAAAARIAGSLPQYREAVRRFAAHWRRTHNAQECVRRLLEAVA
jgi:glycosyltransferase involved in cell wall biosynthesis